MKNQKELNKLMEELSQLKSDSDNLISFQETIKKKISEEIKSEGKQKIKNTITTSEKYTLWQRMKKVLKIS